MGVCAVIMGVLGLDALVGRAAEKGQKAHVRKTGRGIGSDLEGGTAEGGGTGAGNPQDGLRHCVLTIVYWGGRELLREMVGRTGVRRYGMFARNGENAGGFAQREGKIRGVFEAFSNDF